MTKLDDSIAEAYRTQIGVAVLPLKKVAMDAAEKRARERVASIEKELAAAGWDVNAAAPYPGYFETKGWSQQKITLAKAKYQAFRAVTTEDQTKHNTHRMSAPHFVVMAPAKIEEFVKLAREFAATQYDMFVFKLNSKVGHHEAATLEGDHIWGESFLTVTFAGSKPTEVWKTSQIWNVSKLGKDFPQWPSRKVKGR